MTLFMGAALPLIPFLLFSPGASASPAVSAATTAKERLLPCPAEFHAGEGHFQLNAKTAVVVFGSGEEVVSVRDYLVGRLNTATGFSLAAKSGRIPRRAILLSLFKDSNPALGTEGYALSVTPNRIEISANAANGLFYGCQTLLQLLPPRIESSQPVGGNAKWLIPCAEIRDYPRFAWRGLLLDMSRRFLTKEEVMGYVEEMAKYKFNVLQLHLSDDQGWRLEINRYPKLTEVGAWRVPRTGTWWSFAPPQPGEKATYGGFYTQDDMREIVQYAAKRRVTILPEIEMPAHSLSAQAAYPELSCTGSPTAVNPGSIPPGNCFPVLCASNEAVYDFIEGVMTEVAALFPGEYIHMGGDEAHKAFWKACPRCQALMREQGLKDEDQLQSYFVHRVERIIESKGKKMIGWDGILEGGLSPNATVMSWRGIVGGIEAAKMGHHIVMAASPYYYLDLFQGDPAAEPLTYGMNRLKTTYEFEPLPEGIDPKLVLGGQGCVWGEQVPDIRHAQYMTWPRGMAIAETLWSPKESKNWESFVPRVEGQFPRLDAAKVKYARSMYDAIITPRRGDQDELIVDLSTEISGIDIHYTWNGTNPDQFHPKYDKPLLPPPGATELRVVTYRDGSRIGKEIAISLAELQRRAPEKPKAAK